MGKRRDPRIRTAGIAASITRAQLTTLVCARGRAGTAAGTRAVQPSRFAGSRRLPVYERGREKPESGVEGRGRLGDMRAGAAPGGCVPLTPAPAPR